MAMYGYNFTPDVRAALAKAREEANRLGHPYVGTEHLALGVVQTARGASATLLASLDRAAVVAELERRAGPGAGASPPGGDLPYTSAGKRVLELAMREALELASDRVDTAHMLLGILREERGIGARVLCENGLELVAARGALLAAASGGAARVQPTRPRRLLVRLLEWAGLIPPG